jgi:hypothetical protein
MTGTTDMADSVRVSSVRYVEVPVDHLERRGLGRHVGLWSLWAPSIGAVRAGLVISAVTLIVLFFNDRCRPAVIWCALWFLAGLVYFGVYARLRMVRSPEEELAITGRHTESAT